METKIKNNAVSDTGYNPKIQITTGSYSISYFQESSAANNTTAEYIKNRTIIVNQEVKKY